MRLVEREQEARPREFPPRRAPRSPHIVEQEVVPAAEPPRRQPVLRKPQKLNEIAAKRAAAYDEVLAHVRRELGARQLVTADSVPDLGWGALTQREPMSFCRGLLGPLRSLAGARELGDIRDSLIRLAAWAIAYAWALEQKARGHDAA